jgi:septum site-determining protein MinD
MIEPDLDRPVVSIAVVSGKGGSGKTMIAAAMAEILSAQGLPVILVDADTGTAGLTFYLGLEMVANTAVGVSNFLSDDSRASNERWLQKWLQPIKGFPDARFMSAGDRRMRLANPAQLDFRIRDLMEALRSAISSVGFVIFDCRGGVDAESLAICHEVDEIILIAESDITSSQASRELTDILASAGVAEKLKGFIINKVFEDPARVARDGTALFRSQFLSAIPFEFEGMRDFFEGKVPPPRLDLRNTCTTRIEPRLSLLCTAP